MSAYSINIDTENHNSRSTIPYLNHIFRNNILRLTLALIITAIASSGIPRTSFAQDGIDVSQRVEAMKPFRFGPLLLTPDLATKSTLASSVNDRIAARKQIDAAAESRAYVFLRLSEIASNSRRTHLEKQGVLLLARLGAKTWVASTTEAGARHLTEDDKTYWASPIQPDMKFEPGLKTATLPAWRERPGGTAVFAVVFHKDVTASEVVALAGVLGAELEGFQADQFPTLRTVYFVMDPGRLDELAAAESVSSIGPSSPLPTPNNEGNVQPLSNVDVVHAAPYNLTGANVSVGIWEANDGTFANPEYAVRDTHDNFEYMIGTTVESRVILEADAAGPPPATGYSDHATGVAGTLGAADRDPGAPPGSLENGRVDNAEGMAPDVTIASWSLADNLNHRDDLSEMYSAVTSPGGPTDPTPIEISNHSYGVNGGWIFRNTPDRFLYRNNAFFGRYTFRVADFDALIAAHDLLVFTAANNDRNDDHDLTIATATLATDPTTPDLIPPTVDPPADCNTGGFTTPGGADVDADCLSPIATAKNVFTIGSANGAAALGDFSSFGPTDDGRIKPDLIAHGVRVITTAAASDNDDTAFPNPMDRPSGTSLSSPVGAGVAALMLEQADRLGFAISSAGMKALLVQTAIDFTADPYRVPPLDSPEVMTGPDFASGWGIINAEAAADLLRLPAGPGLREGTLTEEGDEQALRYPVYLPDDQPELKVTLAWTDPAGTGVADPVGAQDAVGSTTAEGPGTATGVLPSVLVNDLDLRLVSPTGIVHLPWGLDPEHPEQPAQRNAGRDDRNNVEQVSVRAPETGLWWAEVSAGVGAVPSRPQVFALAGPLNGIKIAEPTRGNPARAGTPTNGGRVLVRLRASAGLDLSLSKLVVEVDSTILDRERQVALHSQPGQETWLVIAPGAKDIGCYDLKVSLVDIPEVSDTSHQSLCYRDSMEVIDRVVAVDRTNSMRGEKMVSARDAASAFVALSNDWDSIGLSQFQLVDSNDDGAVELAELAQIVQSLIQAQPDEDTDNRIDVRVLAENITPDSGDWDFPYETSIGAAIRVSFAELDANAQLDATRQIVLVTDGRENYPPYWEGIGSGTTLKEEISSIDNLIIHTVGIGQDAEHGVLQDISESTGGFHIPPDVGEASYSLLSRLTSIFKLFDEDIRGEQRFFYKEGVPDTLAPGSEFDFEGTFTVEPYLDWMTVSFHWEPDPSEMGVLLYPPDTDTSDPDEPPPVEPLTVSDDKHTTYRIQRPEPGVWRYRVPGSIKRGDDDEFTAIASGPTLLTARLRVEETIKASDETWSAPLRVWIAGDTAITDAEVTGTIIRPDRSKRAISLLDNGSQDDGSPGDGVYGFVADETIPGAYSVEVIANGTDENDDAFERYLYGSFVIPGQDGPPQVDRGRPGAGPCATSAYCCWLWIAFILILAGTLIALARLWCCLKG